MSHVSAQGAGRIKGDGSRRSDEVDYKKRFLESQADLERARGDAAERSAELGILHTQVSLGLVYHAGLVMKWGRRIDGAHGLITTLPKFLKPLSPSRHIYTLRFCGAWTTPKPRPKLKLKLN